MIDDISADIQLEKKLQDHFGFSGRVTRVVGRNLPSDHLSKVALFFDNSQNLYAFIEARSKITLADVRKMLLSMNLKPLSYTPPKYNQNYFEDMAMKRFMKVFPGRRNVGPSELKSYRMSAPYNPALVQISEIRDGVIKVRDNDSRNGWHRALKFGYKKSS